MTTDTQARPMTDAQLDSLRQANSGELNFVTLREFRVVARAIERAYGIGGEPYYLSGPAPDGAWLVCEAATGRVVHRIAEHIGTHAPGCHAWGPRHYACAQTELQRLAGENGVLRGLLAAVLPWFEEACCDEPDALILTRLQELRDRVRAALAGEAGGLL